MRIKLVVVLLVAGLVLLAGCQSDPKAQRLAERAKWEVELLSWAQGEVSLTVAVRIIGPRSTEMEQLTVLFRMVDAADQPLAEQWHTFNVSSVRRGTPKELTANIPIGSLGEISGLQLEHVTEPTPEQEAHIVELSGLDAGA